MKYLKQSAAITAAVLVSVATSFAQPPNGGGRQRDNSNVRHQEESPASFLMQYDSNGDGSLIQSEVPDRRFHRILSLADQNSDGKATAQELTSYFDNQSQQFQSSRGGLGGFPPPGQREPGGQQFGGPPPGGGFGQQPRPGQILPDPIIRELKLSEAQQRKLADLQKHVDEELAKLLTRAQQEQISRFSSQRNRRNGPPPGSGPRDRPAR